MSQLSPGGVQLRPYTATIGPGREQQEGNVSPGDIRLCPTNGNKRQHVRVPLILSARFDVGREARVLDLSVGGVRLEHVDALRRGAACRLRFALNDEVYLFSACVIWSRPVQPQDGGSGGLFHSGLAFEGMPDAAKPLLAELAVAVG